jgi:hypothetical protein
MNIFLPPTFQFKTMFAFLRIDCRNGSVNSVRDGVYESHRHHSESVGDAFRKFDGRNGA